MATVQRREDRPGRPWEVRYRTPDGGSRRRQFPRQVDAKRFAATVETDKLRGAWVDPSAGKVTFQAFAERWLAAQTFDESSREATGQRLRVHAFPYLGDLELRAIQPSTVQQWLRSRSASNAPSHVRVMFVNVSAVLAAAVDDGLIVRNPCAAKSVRAPRVERPLIVPWPVERVLAVIAEHPERWRAIPAVAAGCGLRQGEVFGLRREDVDFLGRMLRVRQQVKRVGGRLVIAPPKGGKLRDVPLPEPVALALSAHVASQPAGPGGLVFTGTRGGVVDRSSFNQYVWRPALKRAGVPGGRENGMHALRHHYASVLIDGGESVKAVQAYLGHASASFTLDVYGHLMPASEDRTRRAVEAAWAACVPAVSQTAS